MEAHFHHCDGKKKHPVGHFNEKPPKMNDLVSQINVTLSNEFSSQYFEEVSHYFKILSNYFDKLRHYFDIISHYFKILSHYF